MRICKDNYYRKLQNSFEGKVFVEFKSQSLYYKFYMIRIYVIKNYEFKKAVGIYLRNKN